MRRVTIPSRLSFSYEVSLLIRPSKLIDSSPEVCFSNDSYRLNDATFFTNCKEKNRPLAKIVSESLQAGRRISGKYLISAHQAEKRACKYCGRIPVNGYLIGIRRRQFVEEILCGGSISESFPGPGIGHAFIGAARDKTGNRLLNAIGSRGSVMNVHHAPLSEARNKAYIESI